MPVKMQIWWMLHYLLSLFTINFMGTFFFVLSTIIEMFPGISELMNLQIGHNQKVECICALDTHSNDICVQAHM